MQHFILIFIAGMMALIAFRLSSQMVLLLFGIYFLCMIISFIGFLAVGEYKLSMITGSIVLFTVFRMRQAYKRFDR